MQAPAFCCQVYDKNVQWTFFSIAGKYFEKGYLKMASLYFYYGAMGSSKTANALMTNFNYREVGKKALLCKPGIDTRDGKNVIHSRIGLEEACITLEELETYSADEIRKYDCIIVDEAQFATVKQIDRLSDIVDFMDVPVICYGLRADFRQELFPGSERLLTVADKLQEIKTVCWCGRKATCNARYNQNGIVKEGSQIQLGANDSYVALCRRHYKLGMLSAEQEDYAGRASAEEENAE